MNNSTPAPQRTERLPVLYLDLDDTLVSWASGHPEAAPGARSFMLWALPRFEVRWLTTWCPSGEMPSNLLRDLCSMLEVEEAQLQHIRGFDWDHTESKINGVAWLEHLVLGRPFLWIEDENGVGEREREFLAASGVLDRYRHCNVTRDPLSLRRLHRQLEEEWASDDFGPAGAVPQTVGGALHGLHLASRRFVTADGAASALS